MTFLSSPVRAVLCLLLACMGVAACSSSFGSGGGSSPAPTYVILPNGDEVPARAAP
jgi:hypothetical protein